MKASSRVEVLYCTQCKWLLRAAWIAQELLSTFSEELREVALIPAKGGLFEVRVNGELLWCRENEGGFPQIKELKKRLRDHVDPDRSLGHIDR